MSHYNTLIDLKAADVKVGKRTSFETAAATSIEMLMRPFFEGTSDPDYLEFINTEIRERDKYENTVADCVRMPNGSVLFTFDRRFTDKYTIVDGVVYQRNFGQLKHNKRTKRAKRIKPLLAYPLKKIYKSYADFLENYCGYSYDADNKAYGYYCNPNAQWDWYQIGGRWPFHFLVREDAKCIVTGEHSWTVGDDVRKAPEGYIWAAGAKKAEIEWERMKTFAIEEAANQFHLYEKWFETGNAPEGKAGAVTENGIIYGSQTLYIKGETLDAYLGRHNLDSLPKYLINTYAYLHNGEWSSLGNAGWFGISSNEKETDVWNRMVQEYIDGLPDDSILVAVDCHI